MDIFLEIPIPAILTLIEEGAYEVRKVMWNNSGNMTYRSSGRRDQKAH